MAINLDRRAAATSELVRQNQFNDIEFHVILADQLVDNA
jgi:hypothetical protein